MLFGVRRYYPSIAFPYFEGEHPEFSKERGIIYDLGADDQGAEGQTFLDSQIAHEILHCCEPEHCEQMRTQMRHARNHGGISGPAAVAQRPQDALRFAASRSSRALVRATSSSADRFGAVPKNTSSGVWPRKAA